MQQDPEQGTSESNPQNSYPPQPQGSPTQPGFPPPSQQPKKCNPLLIIGGVIGGLLLVRCIGGVILASRATPNRGAKVGNTSTSSSTNTPSGSRHVKVGDQLKGGDTCSITVTSVKTSGGDEAFQPKAGNTFLIVDVTVKNVSSQEQNLSTLLQASCKPLASLLQFALKDATGQKYSETFTTNATPPDGQIAFEVPKSQRAFTFTLALEADLLSGGQTSWDLKASSHSLHIGSHGPLWFMAGIAVLSSRRSLLIDGRDALCYDANIKGERSGVAPCRGHLLLPGRSEGALDDRPSLDTVADQSLLPCSPPTLPPTRR